MEQLKAYLKFLWRSKNQHGVHSPFVYGLVTRCLYDSTEHSSYPKLRRYRQELLQRKDQIEVLDLGAGSKIFRSNNRQVSAIAKYAGSTPKKSRLLNRLVRYLDLRQVLELGTSVGIGTAALAMENTGTHITTIEACPATAQVAAEQFKKFGLSNVSLKIDSFDNFLGKVEGSYDLVFIDGNHSKEGILDSFRKLLPRTNNDTVFIIDDIHWSKDMENAWHQIKHDPAVRVSIDLFFWGMIFFRKEQAREHFVIRV